MKLLITAALPYLLDIYMRWTDSKYLSDIYICKEKYVSTI